MLIVMAAVLLVILGLCVYKFRTEKQSDMRGLWVFIGGVFIIIFGAFLFSSGVNQLAAEGRIAELDEMRRMISEVGPDNANMEDVYGEAAKLNRKLAKVKRYNQMFIFEPWCPDKYVEQDLIPLSVSSQN